MSTYVSRFTVFNLSEHACSISGLPEIFAMRDLEGGRSKCPPAGGPTWSKPPTPAQHRG